MIDPSKRDMGQERPLEVPQSHIRASRSFLKNSKKAGQFLITMEKIKSQGVRVIERLQADMSEKKVKTSINASAAVPRIYTKTDEEKGKNVGIGIFKDAGETDPKTVPTLTRTKRALELSVKKNFWNNTSYRLSGR